MEHKDSFIFDFTHLPKHPETYQYTLGRSFFADVPDAEISDGDILLEVTLQPLSSERLLLLWHYTGSVEVPCDRCLDPLSIDMEIEEQLEVIIGDELDDENNEVITLNAQDPIYDFKWIAYELLALHLPIQRVHKIEDCNPNMVKYLTSSEPYSTTNEDPRWKKLKLELKHNKGNNNN